MRKFGIYLPCLSQAGKDRQEEIWQTGERVKGATPQPGKSLGAECYWTGCLQLSPMILSQCLAPVNPYDYVLAFTIVYS
jgi:hypothetical protein